MKEHFKGVIWPRESVKGKKKGQKVYRYVVVGMLLTDKPIGSFEGQNELFLDGPVVGLDESLVNVRVRIPSRKLGDATDVLVSLSDL